MNFNEKAFRRAFREACAARGIDPETGATVYQAANTRAEAAKAAHPDRMAQLTRNHAAAHPDNFDDGYGGVDRQKVRRQASRLWWMYAPYWRQHRFDGDGIERPTEVQAVRNLHTEIMAREGRPERVIVAIRTLWRDERAQLLDTPNRVV